MPTPNIGTIRSPASYKILLQLEQMGLEQQNTFFYTSGTIEIPRIIGSGEHQRKTEQQDNTNKYYHLPFFIRRKLGTSKIDYGDKI